MEGCPICKKSLFQEPDVVSVERSTNLKDATCCCTKCGHLVHCECLSRMFADVTSPACPVCKVAVARGEAYPVHLPALMAPVQPVAASGDAPFSSAIGKLEDTLAHLKVRTAAAALTTSHPAPTTLPSGSTRTAIVAFGGNNDAKLAKSNDGSKSNPPSQPKGIPWNTRPGSPLPGGLPFSVVLFLFLDWMGVKDLETLFTEEVIRRFDEQCDLILAPMMRNGLMDTIEANLDTLNRRLKLLAEQTSRDQDLLRQVLNSIINTYNSWDPEVVKNWIVKYNDRLERIIQWMDDEDFP